MKLSFCITCKNRFTQIKQTLPQNLRNNSNHKHLIEFILVDFDSTDGLMEWVKYNFEDEIRSGYLKYYFTENLPAWDCPIAKNTSHRLGTGEILVNLDCDNYTGKSGGLYVIKQFEKYGDDIILHQASGISQDGSYGRIALLKRYFNTIGGYNQSFAPMAYQDNDLILRSIEIGLLYTCKNNTNYNKAIKNSKEEGLIYTDKEQSYVEMLNRNISISNESIFFGNIVANNNNNNNSIGIADGLFQLRAGELCLI